MADATHATPDLPPVTEGDFFAERRHFAANVLLATKIGVGLVVTLLVLLTIFVA